ncbi:Fur family transcriptional regulator [Chloroflexota bacterium]
MPVEKKVISVLKQRGYRLTPQRRAVLGVINRSRGHLTPAAVYERVRRQYPKIGLVTVYRTLELLTQLGFICRVHCGDNNRSYLLRRSFGHHHHLVCSGCDKVMDFTDCDLAEMEKKIAESTGFRIESHLVEFTGRCSECLAGAVGKC